jgi:hypothetical protein
MVGVGGKCTCGESRFLHEANGRALIDDEGVDERCVKLGGVALRIGLGAIAAKS